MTVLTVLMGNSVDLNDFCMFFRFLLLSKENWIILRKFFSTGGLMYIWVCASFASMLYD